MSMGSGSRSEDQGQGPQAGPGAAAVPELWLLLLWAGDWVVGMRALSSFIWCSPNLSICWEEHVLSLRFLPSKLGERVGCEETEDAWASVLVCH